MMAVTPTARSSFGVKHFFQAPPTPPSQQQQQIDKRCLVVVAVCCYFCGGELGWPECGDKIMIIK